MKKTINLILKCLAVGCGVSVMVLNIMNKIDIDSSTTLLGIGLTSLAISQLDSNKKH